MTSNKENTMRNDGTYNGWANYETWRVNLEFLDGMTPEDLGYDKHELDSDDYENVEKLSKDLEWYVTDLLKQDAEGFALTLALDFLRKVDWEEIASHMIYDHVNA